MQSIPMDMLYWLEMKDRGFEFVSRSEWFRLKVQDGEFESAPRSQWLWFTELCAYHMNGCDG